MLLANYFSSRMSFELGKENFSFSKEAIVSLENYSWPGNVRELKNVVERAVHQSKVDNIVNIVFDPFQSPFDALPGSVLEKNNDEKSMNTLKRAQFFEKNFKPMNFKSAVQKYEISLIENALSKARYNQKRAAELLDMSYDQFRGKIKKYSDRFVD